MVFIRHLSLPEKKFMDTIIIILDEMLKWVIADNQVIYQENAAKLNKVEKYIWNVYGEENKVSKKIDSARNAMSHSFTYNMFIANTEKFMFGHHPKQIKRKKDKFIREKQKWVEESVKRTQIATRAIRRSFYDGVHE